jgi:alpha-beta hydrolase superfamily lysophospholipase
MLEKIAGESHRSEFMRNMVFKPYNNAFKPVRTQHDWISSDPDAVDRYIQDPHCGFIPTASFLHDFFKGLQQTQKASPFSGPHTYPVLIVAGSEDPISKPVDGIRKLKEKLTKSGIGSPDTLIYQGGRHEMLSETNRHQVMKDVAAWMKGKL